MLESECPDAAQVRACQKSPARESRDDIADPNSHTTDWLLALGFRVLKFVAG